MYYFCLYVCLLFRPCATVIESRAPGNPLCFEHMAERLGFNYHLACGNETTDELCNQTFDVDIDRVLRLTFSALRDYQVRAPAADSSGNESDVWQVSPCVQNAELYMRSHERATLMVP